MIICVCKAVSDKSIRRNVASGEVISLRDLSRETGLGTCCGKCVPAAREVLSAALSSGSSQAISSLPGFGLAQAAAG